MITDDGILAYEGTVWDIVQIFSEAGEITGVFLSEREDLNKSLNFISCCLEERVEMKKDQIILFYPQEDSFSSGTPTG